MVIHKGTDIYYAVPLNETQHTIGHVIKEFSEYMAYMPHVRIDISDWPLREWVDVDEDGVILNVRDEKKITPALPYPELIPDNLILYPNGRTRSMDRVLNHLIRYDEHKLDAWLILEDELDSRHTARRLDLPVSKPVVRDLAIYKLFDDGLVGVIDTYHSSRKWIEALA